MLRIAIVCPYYPFPPSVGGVETIVRNISTELARRGHEIHIVTTPFDVTTMKQVSDYGIEEKNGVILHKLRPGRLRIGYARFLKGLKETIREIKPEIVHSHNLHPHLFQLARWKNQLGYRLAAELHHPAINLDFKTQKILLPFAVHILKYMYKNIDAFISHTKLERNWLISNGIPSHKICVIFTPGLPKEIFDAASNINMKRKNIIVYISRITPKKGLHILIKAFALLLKKKKDITLFVAGAEEPHYINIIQRLIKKLELEKHIIFRGYISDNEKYIILKQARIFSLPTLADYHPIALLEAQALGVPVVATRVGAVPEIVKDGETGILVPPNNAKILANALETLLTNNELWEKMSIRAREWARRFTIEGAVGKLEKIYKILVES